MAYSSQTFSIPYVTGINESSGDVNVNAYIAPYAQNIHTTYGVLETARGYGVQIPTALPAKPTRIYLFTDITATGARKRHIIVTTETSVLVWDDTLQIWNKLFDDAKSGDWGFLTYQKADDVILIMGNGKDNVKFWDGTSSTLSDLKGVPCKGRFFALHYERVWMCGDPEMPNSVFYSRQFNPNDWTGDIENPTAGGGQVDLPTFELGGFITGIYTVANEVVVMKESTAIRIWGTSPSSYTASEVVGEIGTKAERAIIGYGGAQYFLTRHGLGVQSGSAVSMLNDRSMPRVFDGNYYTGDGIRMNQCYQQTACGTRYDNKLWFAIPLGDTTENNAIIEYDPARETLMLHRGLSVVDFAQCDQEDDFVLFVGHGEDGAYRVYEYGGVLNYNGKAQKSVWESAWQEMGDKGRKKIVRQVRMYGDILKVDPDLSGSPSVKVTVETDRGHFIKRFEPFPFRPLPQSFRCGMRLSGERFRVIVESGDNSRFRFGGGVELEVEQE